MPIFAQGVLEYSRTSTLPLTDSLREVLRSLADGLRDVDQQTWLIIGGVLIALWFFTRRRPPR